MSKHKKYLEAAKLLGFILLCLLAGVIGALFTATGPTSWYSHLVKPSFNPPNWIFGPVWTLLYILMGISLYFAVKKKVGLKAIKIFAIQLLLNTLWTILFFGLNNILFALVEVVILLGFIIWTIKAFYKKSEVSSYLLIPYALWTSFATILTLAIYLLN
jgi:tryptophan-rich sensory protein